MPSASPRACRLVRPSSFVRSSSLSVTSSAAMVSTRVGTAAGPSFDTCICGAVFQQCGPAVRAACSPCPASFSPQPRSGAPGPPMALAWNSVATVAGSSKEEVSQSDTCCTLQAWGALDAMMAARKCSRGTGWRDQGQQWGTRGQVQASAAVSSCGSAIISRGGGGAARPPAPSFPSPLPPGRYPHLLRGLQLCARVCSAALTSSGG